MKETVRVYGSKDVKAFLVGCEIYECKTDPVNGDDYVDWDSSAYIGELIKEAQHYEDLFDRFAGVGIHLSKTDKLWLDGIMSRIIKKAKLVKN